MFLERARKAFSLIILIITLVNPLTSAAPQFKGLTTPVGPICVDSTLWSLPTFNANDCSRALQKLLNGDLTTWGKEVVDFHVKGAASQSQFPSIPLPLFYEYGTCTLAITMLATIPLRHIHPTMPVAPGTFFPETDRSTFDTLARVAQRVKRKCVDNGGGDNPLSSGDFRATRPGWMTAGSLNAVGVFFFDSRSYVKKTVERDLFGGEGE